MIPDAGGGRDSVRSARVDDGTDHGRASMKNTGRIVTTPGADCTSCLCRGWMQRQAPWQVPSGSP